MRDHIEARGFHVLATAGRAYTRKARAGEKVEQEKRCQDPFGRAAMAGTSQRPAEDLPAGPTNFSVSSGGCLLQRLRKCYRMIKNVSRGDAREPDLYGGDQAGGSLVDRLD
jgi:hypothetical protein